MASLNRVSRACTSKSLIRDSRQYQRTLNVDIDQYVTSTNHKVVYLLSATEDMSSDHIYSLVESLTRAKSSLPRVLSIIEVFIFILSSAFPC